MTEIYLHIVARMADYMDTHPYVQPSRTFCSTRWTPTALDRSGSWSWGGEGSRSGGEGADGEREEAAGFAAAPAAAAHAAHWA